MIDKKELEPQIEIICLKHMACCMYNSGCLGEFNVLPDGRQIYTGKCCAHL